jgi:hypothetical protein
VINLCRSEGAIGESGWVAGFSGKRYQLCGKPHPSGRLPGTQPSAGEKFLPD